MLKFKIDINHVLENMLGVLLGGALVIVGDYFIQNREFHYKDKKLICSEYPKYISNLNTSFNKFSKASYDISISLASDPKKSLNSDLKTEVTMLTEAHECLRSSLESIEILVYSLGWSKFNSEIYAGIDEVYNHIKSSTTEKAGYTVYREINNKIPLIKRNLQELSKETKSFIIKSL